MTHRIAVVLNCFALAVTSSGMALAQNELAGRGAFERAGGRHR